MLRGFVLDAGSLRARRPREQKKKCLLHFLCRLRSSGSSDPEGPSAREKVGNWAQRVALVSKHCPRVEIAASGRSVLSLVSPSFYPEALQMTRRDQSNEDQCAFVGLISEFYTYLIKRKEQDAPS